MRGVKLIGMVAVATAFFAVVGASPVAAGPPYAQKRESYIVDTRHGKLYVEVVRPTDAGQDVAGPAIFTYSPYSILGRNGDAGQFVPSGYVRVWADVVGTGNSGGCWDYGGIREKETGYALVEWIAAQPWSTGKVGMIGGSYNGTTATATAVMSPPHLTTIVPEAAISRWYEYAYSGGVRYFDNTENPADEGFDTPLAFDFGLAIPPPLNPGAPDWAERVRTTVTPCDELVHTQHGYDDTPDYDAFWKERDYIRVARRINIPVLVAHNWGDWNVKQEEAINLYRALVNAPVKKLFMGTRYSGHGTPGGTTPSPGGTYRQTVRAWFDHFLMGIDNGIENMADVHSEMSDYDGRAGWYAGPWPATRPVTLFAQEDASDPDYAWKLLPTKAPATAALSASFVSTGTNAESTVYANPRANAGWLWFETPPLARDVRIFGEVKVKLWSTIQRQWITYTPTIVDVPNGDNLPFSATRGWLDTRYRSSLASQSLVTPGDPFLTTVVEKPQEYTFLAGNRIGLAVQTEIVEWNVPKAPDCAGPGCETVRVELKNGRTQVVLPVVDAPADPRDLFERP